MGPQQLQLDRPEYLEALEQGSLPFQVLECGVPDFGVPPDAAAYKQCISQLVAMLAQGHHLFGS